MRLVPAALLLLLDGGDDPPRGPAGADDILVGDGQQVALLHRELFPIAASYQFRMPEIKVIRLYKEFSIRGNKAILL